MEVAATSNKLGKETEVGHCGTKIGTQLLSPWCVRSFCYCQKLEQVLLLILKSTMLIDIAILMLAFLLSIPAITGYFAYSYGKSFWVWFIIGCLLPVIAQLVLAYVCRKEALKERRRKSTFISRYEDEQLTQEIGQVLHQTLERRNLS